MRHSGSGFAQGKLPAGVQGSLVYSTKPDETGADARDADTDNVREAMRGAWGVGVHGMVQGDTHQEGELSRNHVGPLEHNTRSRHPAPVAVQTERGRCLRAQCCYSQTGSGAGSCCSQWLLAVVALNTDKMVYETECLARMYLAGEELADVVGLDIAHIRAHFCLTNSCPQDRGLEEAEDIGHKALLAYHTECSTQRRWDRREHSVAEGVGHTDHKELRRSVAADTEYSVADAGSDRIDAVGVLDAEAEATMTGTEPDMVVEVRVADGVADGLMGEGALVGSGEGADVGADGGRVRERDVGAEVVGHR